MTKKTILLKMMFALLTIFILLLSVRMALATTYNVPTNYTWTEALNLSEAGDTINVTSGTFGPLINKSITVLAYGATATYLNISEFVHLQGGTVSGGVSSGYNKIGLYVSSADIIIEDLTVQSITGSTGSCSAAGHAYGIIVQSNCERAILNNVTIKAITGGAGRSCGRGYNGGDGGDVYALYSYSNQLEIKNSNITDIDSGTGGNGDASADAYAIGGDGGTAYGVYLQNHSTIVHSYVTDIEVGNSGNSDSNVDCGSIGGVAGSSSYMVNGVDYNIIRNNTFYYLRGGYGGVGDPGSGCPGYWGSSPNGANGGSVTVMSLENNNKISSNTIYDIESRAGRDGIANGGAYCSAGGAGGDAGSVSIIYLESINDVHNNTIYDISTSDAGNAASYTAGGLSGGDTGTIYLIRTTYDSDVYGNNISDVEGGTAGYGGWDTSATTCGRTYASPGGTGSTIYAIYLSSNSTMDSTTYTNIIENLTGGDGGNAGSGTGSAGLGGSVYGIYINDDSDYTTHYNNDMNDFVWGEKGCNSKGTDCVTNPESFGDVYPIYPERLSEITEQSSGVEASGGTYLIEWYTALNVSSITATGAVLDMNYSIYRGNTSTSQDTFITNATYNYNCTNIKCNYTWSYGSNKGIKWFKINSTDSVFTGAVNESISKYYLILPYGFDLTTYALSSPVYRTTDLICNFTASSDLNYTTLANISWYRDGVLNTSTTEVSVTLNSNTSSGLTIDKTDLTVDEVWNCSVTAYDDYLSTSNSDTSTVWNYVPSNPTNITCNESTCTPSAMPDDNILTCLGSTDTEDDTIIYYLGAWVSGMESLPNGTVLDKKLDIDFCDGISGLEFLPDLDNFNFTSLTLTEYGVIATNVTACLYNATCSFNCPINITAKVSATSATHQMNCSGTVLNTSYQRIYSNITSGSYSTLNCTMNYIAATAGYDFNISFSTE